MSSEDQTHSSATEDDDEEEEESNSPPDGGREKRAASTNQEAEAPKRGKGPLADNSVWDVDISPEQRPRSKPLAALYVLKKARCIYVSGLSSLWY